LYGVSFPYFEKLSTIYSKDLGTGEGAEGFGKAVKNLANETVAEERDMHEEDMVSRDDSRQCADTQSHSLDTSTSSKRQKKVIGPEKAGQSDPTISMLEDFNNQVITVTIHVRRMRTVAEHEVALNEKVMHEDANYKKLVECIGELVGFGLSESEIVDAATIFDKAPENMHTMLALPRNLWREYVVNMLKSKLISSLDLDAFCCHETPLMCAYTWSSRCW
jgi:hypothetical protein